MSAPFDLTQIAEVRVLRPQAGDTVVLRSARRLSQAQYAALREQLKGALPAGVRVAVIDTDLDIDVIRAERAQREWRA